MQKQICQKGVNIYVTYDEQSLSTSANVVTIKEGEKTNPEIFPQQLMNIVYSEIFNMIRSCIFMRSRVVRDFVVLFWFSSVFVLMLFFFFLILMI